MKPDPERAGMGKNVSTKLTYDPAPVKKRYEELVRLGAKDLSTAIREEADDIEAARLIIAHDYMSHHRRQLAEQLRALRPWLEEA